MTSEPRSAESASLPAPAGAAEAALPSIKALLPRLAADLGMDPRWVRGITIHLKANALPTVVIERGLSIEETRRLASYLPDVAQGARK